jgi:hypothetical protein
MVPLYATRIEDLGPGDLVRVECAACGHDVLIPPGGLLHGLRLAPTAACSIWNRGCGARSAVRGGRRLCRSNGVMRHEVKKKIAPGEELNSHLGKAK